MIFSSMIVPLLLSTQIMASAERQQYSNCLRSFVDAQVREGTAADAFETAFAAACRQQESAYRTAYIAAAVRAGDRRPLAESDAAVEAEDLRSNFKELFQNAREARPN
jgi:hypothetical protein